MSVVFVGDLHLDRFTEFGIRQYYTKFIDEVPVSTELIVLLGDICDGNPISNKLVCDFITALTNRYNRVIAVLGNHDYYHMHIHDTYKLVSAYRLLGVEVCNNECVTVKGVGTLLLSTLWAGLPDMSSTHNTVSTINDFEVIVEYSPELCITAHNHAVNYIKANYHRVDYVVTHFAPSYMSKSEQYKAKHRPHLDQYFYTELFNYGDLEGVLDANNTVQWVHGHTHSTLEYTVTDKLKVNSVGACDLLHIK